MADGEDEPEFEVDQLLSESHKFALYKDREGYHSLWYTSFVPSKQVEKSRQKALKNCRKNTTFRLAT